tara:strand:+ start:7532 stop:8542 length:1011 start_codon:yes stop_codon:yes gene_type:complete
VAENKRKVLVTGGAGFVGSHLVKMLVDEGCEVRVLEKPGALTHHLPSDRVEIVHVDLRDPLGVKNAAEGCQVVLHLAANPNLWARDSEEFEQVNHQGTRNVLSAARKAGAGRIVHVSTESILSPKGMKGVITEETQTDFEDMIGPYCESKWLAEEAAREAAESGDPVVIVRPSIPIGPGDRNMGPPSRMICDFCNGRIKAYLDGYLNFIDVRDVAAGIWIAAQRGEVGRSYLLVHENWTIVDLFRYLSKLVDRPAPQRRIPYTVALTFAYFEEWIRYLFNSRKLPMATVTGVKLTKRILHFNGSRSAEKLDLPPMRDCRTSLLESINWFKNEGKIR